MVRALAGAGGHVTVPVRDRGRAAVALADIAGQIVIADMDLADMPTCAARRR